MAKVKKFQIDLSECQDHILDDYQYSLIGELSRHGVFSEGWMYSVVEGDKHKELERGEIGEMVMLESQRLLWKNPGDMEKSVDRLKKKYISPAIAVWDAEKFRAGEKVEALEAIAYLKMT